MVRQGRKFGLNLSVASMQIMVPEGAVARHDVNSNDKTETSQPESEISGQNEGRVCFGEYAFHTFSRMVLYHFVSSVMLLLPYLPQRGEELGLVLCFVVTSV